MGEDNKNKVKNDSPPPAHPILMSIPTLIKGKSNVPPRNLRHILYFQCFVTTDMFLPGIAAFFEILLLAVSNHVLKRSLKGCCFSAQIDFSAQIYFFNELLPPEGDFSAHIYVLAPITNLLN